MIIIAIYADNLLLLHQAKKQAILYRDRVRSVLSQCSSKKIPSTPNQKTDPIRNITVREQIELFVADNCRIVNLIEVHPLQASLALTEKYVKSIDNKITEFKDALLKENPATDYSELTAICALYERLAKVITSIKSA